MFRRMAPVGGLLLTVFLLAACSVPRPQGALPSAVVPVATNTTQPAATAQPTSQTTGNVTGQAITLQQIRDEIKKITANGGSSYDAIQQYAATLKGKTITGLDGWVANNAYAQDNGSYALNVLLEDPFSKEALASIRNVEGQDTLSAYLDPFPADVAPQVHAGTHIQFDGLITDLIYGIDLSIYMTPSNVKVVDVASTTPTIPAQPIATAMPGNTPPSDMPNDPLNVLTPAQVEQQLATVADLTTYLQSLDGKTVENWTAWLVGGGNGKWQITLEDPFSAASAAAAKRLVRGDSRQLIDIIMQPTADNANAHIGQMILLNGTLHYTQQDTPNNLFINSADYTIVEDRLAGLTTASDLDGAVMNLQRTTCYGTCPEYSVTVYGNGVVVWIGRQYVQTAGIRITVVSQDTVRELLTMYQKAGYFDLADDYTDYMITDLPYSYTSLTYQGQTKTIQHYHGDKTAPARLDILEQRFDELLNTRQWVGN